MVRPLLTALVSFAVDCLIFIPRRDREFAIDRLPIPLLLAMASMLVAARVLRRLPGWAWTYATAGRRGIRRYSLGAELRLLASQARWERTEDPAWLRRVRAWYTQHPDAPPSLGRSYALMLALLVLELALCGCAEPLVHMRTLSTMHTTAAQQCRATPATCTAVKPCTDGLRGAMSAWQSVSEAIAKGDDGTELARTADALVSEGTARAACLIAMPPPKRSK